MLQQRFHQTHKQSLFLKTWNVREFADTQLYTVLTTKPAHSFVAILKYFIWLPDCRSIYQVSYETRIINVTAAFNRAIDDTFLRICLNICNFSEIAILIYLIYLVIYVHQTWCAVFKAHNDFMRPTDCSANRATCARCRASSGEMHESTVGSHLYTQRFWFVLFFCEYVFNFISNDLAHERTGFCHIICMRLVDKVSS